MQQSPFNTFTPASTVPVQLPAVSTVPAAPAARTNKLDEKKFNTKEVIGVAAAAAIAATAIAGFAINHRNAGRLNSVMGENSALRKSFDALCGENSSLQKSIDALRGEMDTIAKKLAGEEQAKADLQKLNDELTKQLGGMKERFADSIDGDLQPAAVRRKVYEQLRRAVTGELNYNPLEPPVTGKGATIFEDAIDLPSRLPTANRAHIRKLDIPEIGADGAFRFTIPDSSEVKIAKAQSIDFTPIRDSATTISEKYADSVQWGDDKIARDILQNFYDGHGQTLDGVQIISTPIGNGKYRVRIAGKSTYTPDKALYIGESTKQDDPRAAGNYGEGLKMATLKLLRDKGADKVSIASDNWRVTYKLGEGSLQTPGSKRVLTYSLDKADDILDGNYLEFETGDRGIIDELRKSIGRFYHSGNTDFRCPDFENDLLGIKVLPKGQKGGLYISGQKFEFDHDYDGLDEMVIFLKEKPPKSVLDPSRDRTSIDESQLSSIASWISSTNKITPEEKFKIISVLEPFWEKPMGPGENKHGQKFLISFLRSMQYNFDDRVAKVHFKFPADKYVAYSNATSDIVLDLKLRGYTVCSDEFHNFGMQNIKELLGEARAHTPLTPDDVEKGKIQVLKEAIKKFTSLEGRDYFTKAELDPHIYLFNPKDAKEARMSSSTLAEAIVDKGESKGFWIDRDYLNRGEFGEVFETALHELCHKIGGDESAEFSYLLTDANKKVYQELLENPETRLAFEQLNKIWNELSAAMQKAA